MSYYPIVKTKIVPNFRKKIVKFKGNLEKNSGAAAAQQTSHELTKVNVCFLTPLVSSGFLLRKKNTFVAKIYYFDSARKTAAGFLLELILIH